MDKIGIIQERLKEIPENKKYEILKSLNESILREEIKELVSAMTPSNYVEITHGNREFGKDLVVIQKGEFGDISTGVIVVRGDIKTRSSGIIDKIKSQVEQCFEHPIYIKATKGPITISHAWIMIAGLMSEGANTRLTREIKRPNINIYDLKWLSDHFTKYYPHVFFEGRVSKYLEDRINYLEEEHLLAERKSGISKQLSDYYVQPTIYTVDSSLELSEDNVTFTLIKDAKHFGDLKRDLKHPNKYLVVGGPGVGKSTALTKLAIDMLSECFVEATALRGNLNESLHIPILIKAKDVLTTVDAKDLFHTYGPGEEMGERFKVQALLIDALDEVTGDLRKNVIEKSIDYASELRASLVICTRNIDTVREETFKLERRELLPFEFNQAVDLFKKIVNNDKMLASLRDGLERVQGQLPFTPLSLLFMVELVQNNKEVPASIVELYDRFFDIALGAEDKMRKDIDVLFDYKIKRKFLEELAYEEMFKKNRDVIVKEEFDSFVETYAKRFQWDTKELEGFILEIERAGLINIKDRVSFLHASFLDYFAACHIADIREELEDLNTYLTDIYFNDIWCDIAFYYAGVRRRINTDLIKQIIEYDKKGDNIRVNVSKMLLGKLLQAGWHSGGDEKMFGIEQALGFREKVSQQASEFVKKRYQKVPDIYADWYTMAVSRDSFGSKFLWPAERALIDKYLNENSQLSIANAIQLVWAMRNKIPENELNEIVIKLLSSTAQAPRDSIEDNMQYTKNLVLLNIVSSNDPTICQAIMKRLRRAYQLNSGLFDRLLPEKRKGFRSEKARRKAKARRIAKKDKKS